MEEKSKKKLGKNLRLYALRVILQLVIQFSPSEKVVRVVYPTFLIAGLFQLPRKRKLGQGLILVGAFANLLVVLANKGLMPVQRSKLRLIRNTSKEIRFAYYLPSGSWVKGRGIAVVDDGKAKLDFLSARFAFHKNERGTVASLGDFFLLTGLIVWVGTNIIGLPKKIFKS